MIPQLKNPYERQANEQRNDLTNSQYMKLWAKAEAYTEGWIDFKEATEPKIQELLQLLDLQKHILNRGAFGGEMQELTDKMIKLLKP